MSMSIFFGSIALNVSLIFVLFLVRQEKRKNTANHPAPSPVSPSSDVLVIDANQFALVGNDWEWIYDTPASYGCAICGEWKNLELRHYRNISSGSIYALLRHHCPPVQEPVTDAVVEIGGQQC